MSKRKIGLCLLVRNYCWQGALHLCVRWDHGGSGQFGGWFYVDVWSDPDW